MMLRMVLVQQATSVLRMPFRRTGASRAGTAAGSTGGGGPRGGRAGGGGGRTRMPYTLGGGGGPSPAGGGGTTSGGAGNGGSGGRGMLPPPAGAGPGRVGVAWPTGRPVRPYTPQELAGGVDPYTATVRRTTTPPRPQQPRSTRPPIRAAGVQPTASAGPRPVMSPEVNPATVMPPTRPVRPPVRDSWNRPPRRP